MQTETIVDTVLKFQLYHTYFHGGKASKKCQLKSKITRKEGTKERIKHPQ